MVIKILKSASAAFDGVLYNEKKIQNKTGELLTMKNFPSNINHYSSQEEVRNYFRFVSSGTRTKNPQFHITISTKFREHSAEELNQIGQNFMTEMGYGNQPFIIIFHNDTDNNHIHIVSTRVDKNTGKKIPDHFEKIRARKALNKTLKDLKIQDVDTGRIDDLNKLLSYRYSTFNQLKELLSSNGFRIEQKEGNYRIYCDGVLFNTIDPSVVMFQSGALARRNQIRAILYKYKNVYPNKAFKVEDKRDLKDWQTDRQRTFKPKIKWESELQYQLKARFGMEIIFHHKDDKEPFGYTLIDHQSQTVWKGSELLKLAELFEFTEAVLDKKTFEILKDYNVTNQKEENALLAFLKNPKILSFMVFRTNTHKTKRQFSEVRREVIEYLKGKANSKVQIIQAGSENPTVIVPSQHYIGDLKSALGARLFPIYQEDRWDSHNPTDNRPSNSEGLNRDDNTSVTDILSDLTDIILTPTYTSPEEGFKDPLKKKRKKKR